MIVACIGIYGERLEQALVGIRRLRPHVDRYVVIVDETVTDEQKQLLHAEGCEVYYHRWEDSTVKMRNQYLQKCQHGDWVIVHDPDEWFNEAFCEDVRKVTAEAEKMPGTVILLINSHDTTRKLNGTLDSSKSSFYKNLIYHYNTDMYYRGVGEGEAEFKAGWHEILTGPTGELRTVQLPDKYWYEHVKDEQEVWERAMRNVFICGGGNDRREDNPSWKPLRDICATLGLDTWPKLRDYLRKGGVDAKLKEWFWENRFEGMDYDHEEMEGGRWVFEYLHPEEAAYADGRVWKPVLEVVQGSKTEVTRYVEETYLKVLHRHADQEGKEVYAKAILEGRLTREALPLVLQQSLEYRERFLAQAQAPRVAPVRPPEVTPSPSMEVERMRVPVPVNVDIQLTETVLVEALRRSKIWWKIKPRLDLGLWLEQNLGEEQWKKLTEWMYAHPSLTLQEFVKKLESLEGEVEETLEDDSQPCWGERD